MEKKIQRWRRKKGRDPA